MANPTQTVSLKVDSAGFAQSLKDAANLIDTNLTQPAQQSAETLSRAFERSFSGMESALNKAARTGEFSLRSMVDAMLKDLERLAFDQLVAKPVTSLFQSLVANILPFGGGKSVGGPVAPGNAYLVGEHGPELFVPSGSGQIQRGRAARGAGPVINFHITTPDAQSFQRSEAQVTAMLARAVRRGTRNL
jgi:phage-related minor tail protein